MTDFGRYLSLFIFMSPKSFRRLPTLHSLFVLGAVLPIFALVVCVSLCLTLGSCLGTDCTSINVLPSLSAAVSDEHPQRSIWMTCLLISSAIRLLSLPVLWDAYLNIIRRFITADYSRFLCLQFFFVILEVVFLNLMGFFPSSLLYDAHRNSLTVFVFCSVMFMALDSYMFSILRSKSSDQNLETLARKKRYLLFSYFGILAIIATLYYIHTTYCPPYIYSWFSFFEYIGIVINVTYHYNFCGLVKHEPLCKIFQCFSNQMRHQTLEMQLLV